MARRARSTTEQEPVDEREAPGPEQARNLVQLVGRVSAEPEERVLPSGDVLGIFRLVVARPAPRPGSAEATRRPTTDTLDCVAWTMGLRRRVSVWQPGDIVEVQGSLRRRFWRSGAAVSSRYEVEVDQVKRLRRAAS